MNDLYQHKATHGGVVQCLGETFPDDGARRDHFMKLLAGKLQDPDFRGQEGFPSGTDEAILAMSDPPYYTACPNPFLQRFIDYAGSKYDSNEPYVRDPLAVDVSVGKTDPIYKAHAYHTKVPHRAIVPSILHYTDPGDVVLDAFAGSGMTGVAAEWCGLAPPDYRLELELEWKSRGRAAPKWGARTSILADLSPAATFIAANYCRAFDLDCFVAAAASILKRAKSELGWMYETRHTDGAVGQIDYTVWSEVLNCHSCTGEFVFTEAALDEVTQRVDDEVTCPHCGARSNKEQMDIAFEAFVNPRTRLTEKRPRRVPVRIQYRIGGSKFSKKPDQQDIEVLARLKDIRSGAAMPGDGLPDCQMTRVGRMKTTGTTSVAAMFLDRAGFTLAWLWEEANKVEDTRLRHMLLFFVEQGVRGMSTLNRYKPIQYGKIGGSQVGLDLPGVFYVPSIISEVSPWYQFEGKLDRLGKTFSEFLVGNNAAVSTGTASKIGLQGNTVDYIFTDPPFGENIYYSDLNFLVEAWHGVYTDSRPEAIIDRVREKSVHDYQLLVRACFEEYFRVLKPGRWMTVVFSNSRASVWNALQVALQQAGFVVAEVTALDKVQGSFQQIVSPNTVKQDLVISCYKPNGGLEDRFARRGPSADSAWDFVDTHLKQLPVVKISPGTPPELVTVVERDARRIFDRMASWFIRHGDLVPISTPDFLAEVSQRYRIADGMVFLPDQLVEYEKARARVPQVKQAELFVSDERSAIDWLMAYLQKRPSTRSEVHPEYIPLIGAAKKKGEIIPELDQLLKDNFLKYEGKGEVPPQIANWLSKNFHEFRGLKRDEPLLIAKAKDRWYVPDHNKAQDLEKKREEALLRDFEGYVASTARKLKDFRLEVLRAGFKAAWAKKDYATLIKVAQRLPEEALQEDEKLLTLYDLALTRTEAGG